ncbi:hypothetical protein [Ottowia thiooxydans]|uniref:hypothetical protein n=1 Tax=Ottowia thiooxydans TaxID=219182 RepID=UPI00048E6812|nr:hypothetical protein [Ottowia thiooxydans]
MNLHPHTPKFAAVNSRGPLRWRVLCAGLLFGVAHASGAQAAGTTPGSSPAGQASVPKQSGNRIEITGNSVSGVRCAGGGSGSVNSVNIDGASLKGRTVIIQDGNVVSPKDIDCPVPHGGSRQAPVQINSITIR